jgi:hypothetical protein
VPSSCTFPRPKSAPGFSSASNAIQHAIRHAIPASDPASGVLPVDTARILTGLIRADLFEQVIQQRYLGTKRFSLEGLTVLIPFLDQLFSAAAENGVNRSVFAMSHRGRLNVMVNTIGRASREIFTKFEDVDPRSTLGGGDVKYHTGATGVFTTANGKTVQLHLASNPSHLEAADPVVMGRARAYQERIDKENGGASNLDAKQQVLPMIIHGDAAFAGQGIWAETLNLASLHGYNVGGTIQVVVNNLIGFTALPEESNSSRFATDLAKRLPIPIFHVNGEDPEAVARIAALAADYRQTFHSDVVVDLIGYRRHGHSEVDDPTVTQPRRYAIIKDHPPLYKLYAQKLGVDTSAEIAAIQGKFLEEQKAATHASHKPQMYEIPDYWEPFYGGPLRDDDNPRTGLDAAEIASLTTALTTAPAGFHIHPKVEKLLAQRVEMGRGKKPLDYGMAELLAYASLLKTGVPVRLTGQDSQRGTFNQRHSVLIDIENEVRYSPLNNIAPTQARWEVYNTLLSEAACLGFEYGFSRDYPEALVLWEAQFGDFANGAQIIIDQFISAGETSGVCSPASSCCFPTATKARVPSIPARASSATSSSPRRTTYKLPAFNRRAVLPPAAPSGPAPVAQAAHRPHSQVDAAPPRRHVSGRRPQPRHLPQRPSRHRRRQPAPPAGLHRQDRSQSSRRARQAWRHVCRDYLCRAALPLARSRTASRTRPAPLRNRDRLGPGRAGQHGRSLLRAAAAQAPRRRPRLAERQAQRLCQPSHRLGKVPRARRKDPHRPGPRPRLLVQPTQ